jgi:hypothetical protein
MMNNWRDATRNAGGVSSDSRKCWVSQTFREGYNPITRKLALLSSEVAGCNVCSEVSTSSQFYPPTRWQIRLLSIPCPPVWQLVFSQIGPPPQVFTLFNPKQDRRASRVRGLHIWLRNTSGTGNQSNRVQKKALPFQWGENISTLPYIRGICYFSLSWMPAALRLSRLLSWLFQWIIMKLVCFVSSP